MRQANRRIGSDTRSGGFLAGYVSVAELRSRLGIPYGDTGDDLELNAAIDTASRAIEADCQRTFGQVTGVRTFTPTSISRVRFGPFNDLVSLTALAVDPSGTGSFGPAWTLGDFVLLCADGTPNAQAGPEPRPYTQLVATGAQSFPVFTRWLTRPDVVRISGTWGWPAVPAAIRQATLILAAEQFKLRDAPFGVVGVGDLGIARVRQNASADRLLAPYRLSPVLVA